MKFLVSFTQVSHHTVSAIVEASTPEEAALKARAGESVCEFDLSQPESVELKDFKTKLVTGLYARIWEREQQAKHRD